YESGMTVVHAEEVTGLGMPAIIAKARRIVGDGPTYLSFDVDSIDPAFAPGTGTPVAGGPSSAKILSVLRQINQVDIVGADVVEVAPAYDHADITAIAGSTVAMHYLGLLAERKARLEELNSGNNVVAALNQASGI
ncbi:MAG: agmatinase, partial [Mesorhizobium sp.]